MIAAAWMFAFLGFPTAAAVLFIWWMARYWLRLEMRKHRWEARRARVVTLRRLNALDEQARIMVRVRVRDEIAALRAEILESENETPLHLVNG